MTSHPQFNALPLLTVKPALDGSLEKIGTELEQFFASGEPSPLQEAISELHRTYGVLRMLSLDGVFVFCSELEKLLQEFASGSLQASAMHQDVIQRSLQGLTYYINALADGASNAAIRLFNLYEELLQARGIESAFEVDLFYPDLNIELPDAVRAAPPAADAPARIKAARVQYQQALLKWLRQDNPAEALQHMRAAVLAAMACVPPDGQRAFWWVAAGLLDCLIFDGLPPELSARKLMGRIDLQMKALADGAEMDARPTLNEMLYLVAKSHAVSDMVEEIKQRYALDEYLPETTPLAPRETAELLEKMRTQLTQAEETWEKCAHDATACKPFTEQTEQLYGLSERLDRNTLQLLCKQIYTASGHLDDAEYVQRSLVDVAMALLLLEKGIAHYSHLDNVFHEQARILGQRLQYGVSAPQEGLEGEVVKLHCQMSEREIIPLLAPEMQNNLQHVEQELNAFFANPDKREELTHLVRLLNQVQGCLHMLSLDAAEKLLRYSKQAVTRYADGGKPTPVEMRNIATATSALESYVQNLAYGQRPDSAPLEAVLQGMEAPAAPPPAAVAEKAAAPAAAAAPIQVSVEDSELLEVFLEEAQEVLEILRTNLELSQLHPDSMEPLVTMRRGFHTLKGSGRMVGLNDFGEVAWAVERAMNKWLQENKPATPGLLQFIADAEVLFHAWVDALQHHTPVALETAPLVAAAQQVEAGIEPGVVPAPAPQAPPLEMAPEVAMRPAPEPAPAAPPLLMTEVSPLPSLELGPVAPEAAPAALAAELVIPSLEELAPPSVEVPAPAEAPPLAFEFPSLEMETVPAEKPAVPVAEEFVIPPLEEIAIPATVAEEAPQAEAPPLPFELPSLDLEGVPAEKPAAPVAEEFVIPSLEELAPTEAPEAPQPTEIAPPPFEFPSLDLEALTVEQAPSTAEELPAPAEEAPVAAPSAEVQEAVMALEAPAAVPLEVAVAAPSAVAAPQAEAETETETVTIGKVVLSATLFNIATEEVSSNLAVLQRCFAELRSAEPPVISYDFMRAAHTLAGVNRTMGFVAVADLARGLELWLEARIGKPFSLDAGQLELVDQVIAMLDAMFLDICNHQEPQAQPELIAMLQANQEILNAAPLAGEPERLPVEAAPSIAEVPEMAPTEFLVPELGAPASEPEPEPQPVTVSFEPQVIAPPQAAAPALEVVPAQAVSPVEEAVEAPQEARVRQFVEERTIYDEIDQDLLPIFLEESNDLQPQIGSTLRAWRERPDDTQHAHELQRSLHTLKGGARMAGVMRLGELTHRMEDRVVAAMKTQASEATWDELDSYFDRISNALERLRTGGGETEAEAAPPVAPAAEAAQVEAAQPAAAQPAIAQPQAATPQAAGVPAPQHLAETVAARAAAMLRVRSDTVDHLVNEAGEISVARSRAETELRAFKTGLLDMTDSVIRLRKQLREVEIQAETQMAARVALAKDTGEKFDPLEFDRFSRFQELTRFMTESVHDLQTVQQTLLKNLDETVAALSAQAYLNRELQQSLMAIRMVPFASINDRLYRIVRQTAKELNKRAVLDMRGTEVELDRSVLEKMTAPLEHLLRNAVAHGLETQEERTRKGKPPVGEIHVSLRQESNEVVFELSDDGAGLDLARLRQKAAEQGLIQIGVAISDEDARQLIFSSGISTATEVTEISGRGVGMDVVRNEITALGGRIGVNSERGKGTRFIVNLPLTLAVTQILMLRVGPDHYAVPSVMVEQVLHFKPDALENAYLAGQVSWHGTSYPLRYLARLLGNEELAPESRMHNPVLLLRSGEQRVALHVDELMGNQETVVKNIGPQLARLPGIAGATVLGSGRVLLILNPVALAHTGVGIQKTTVTKPVEQRVEVAPEPAPLHAVPIVMVVDDSLTVRKVTSRMLTRAGYEVVTAKDGVDALEQLTQVTPSVMLLDVEMPRMDGFELTKQIRRDPKLHKLPILMITSRTAEKHRDYALELGVNAYFGKPFQEEELLAQIASFIGTPPKH